MRIEFGSGDDLRAQIGRGANEKPDFIIVGESDLGLSAARGAEFRVSNATAVFAGTVPLWESATCRRTQDFDAHAEPAETRGMKPSGLWIYSAQTQKPPLQEAAAAGLLAESGSRKKLKFD